MGLAGGVLGWQLDANALYHYAGFVLSALLLGLSFLSIALLISVLASDRTRASGLAIGAWFAFVLVFDLLLLGLLVASAGEVNSQFAAYALLFNPADVFRILNIFSMAEVQSLYGLATVFPESLANPLLLGGGMVAWIVGPLALAIWRFK